MKLPDGWSPGMVAGALQSAAHGLRQAALELDVLRVRPDLVAVFRREADNLTARGRRLKRRDKQ